MVSIKNSFNKFSKTLNKHWLLVLVLIIILAVVTRAFGITKSSIWHDEGFSIMLSSRDWLGVWLGSARDVHPPLYYELLHGWGLLFGSSALALRSLSAVFGVVVVGLGYFIVLKVGKKHNVAALAGFILALNPFLIRYSQEARMYGVLGVFLLVAMLGVIYITQNHKDWRGYIIYVAGITAGLYTHYFTALVVISFWIYVVAIFMQTGSKKISILTNWRWWLANLAAVILFMPWVPNMLSQLTRGQGLGWLSRASAMTLNDTIWQFTTFTDGRALWPVLYWVVPAILLVVIVAHTINDKTKAHFSRLILLFSFFPILFALSISFFRPIYHERYFVFAAIGLCMLLALAISEINAKNKILAALLLFIVVSSQLVGIRNVNSQSNHQMSTVMSGLESSFKPDDKLIAGELYVYFDSSYYNRTGLDIFLYTKQGRPNGYGESGLIYDKGIYLDSYNDIQSGRVWVIGKTGQHDYYDQVPSSWKLVSTFSAGYSEARLYQIQ